MARAGMPLALGERTILQADPDHLRQVPLRAWMVSCAPTWFRADRMASKDWPRSPSSAALPYPGTPDPVTASIAASVRPGCRVARPQHGRGGGAHGCRQHRLHPRHRGLAERAVR